ncbi:MAG: hypothetical protein HY059_18465 [Proteobacteria bacterium]|nr:hypothetical protein [Pseudomonadota bacterium]
MDDATPADLEAALKKFKADRRGDLVIENGPERHLAVRRFGEQLLIEVKTPFMVEGVAVSSWEAVWSVASDYLAGHAVRLPRPFAQDPGAEDCPLCRAFGFA